MSASEWQTAYARQARADFDTWTELQRIISVPECHRLLFLQMACEKLTKAHLCNIGSRPNSLQSSHAYGAKNLRLILREQLLALGYQRNRIAGLLAALKQMAEQIELLAPAVKRGGQREDNCEYPWEDLAGKVQSPLDWRFTPTELLMKPAGRTFLKAVSAAIDRLT